MNLSSWRGIENLTGVIFFEAHDTLRGFMEETSGYDKLFLQGLIQVSSVLLHLFKQL